MDLEPGFGSLNNPSDTVLLFGFKGEQLAVKLSKGAIIIPVVRMSDLEQPYLKIVRSTLFGHLDGVPCLSGELARDSELPEGMTLITLREAFSQMEEEWFLLAGRAYQIMVWDRDHQFRICCVWSC